MESKHWMMIAVCTVPVVLLLYFYGFTNWSWLILLLCPLMHIFMMKDHMHGKDNKDGKKCH